MLTLSALPRVRKCAASAVLPGVRDDYAAFREAGTARHQYLCDLGMGMSREEALARVPEAFRLMCEMIDTTKLPLAGFSQEEAYAFDVETGAVRYLGANIGRAYTGDPSREVFGSLDVVGMVDDETVYVADYKGDHDDSLTPAKANLQLRVGAVFASRHRGVRKAVVEFIHLRDDGTHWCDRDEMDEIDLQVAYDELRATWREYHAAKARTEHTVTRGDHCRWCPAFAACPGTLSMTRSLFADADSWADRTKVITPEMAAQAYAAVRAAEKAVAKAKEELKRYAEVGAIPLPGGKAYGKVTRENVISARALPVLLRMFGEEVAQAAGKFSVTSSGITEALRGIAKDRGVPLAALNREVRDAMREAGAYATREIIDEYKVKDG